MKKFEIEQTKPLNSSRINDDEDDEDDDEDIDEAQIIKESESGEDVLIGIIRAINEGKYISMVWACLCVLLGVYISTSGYYKQPGASSTAAISMDDFVSRK